MIAVVAVQGEQFVMSAEFDDASAMQDGDAVGIAHRRDAVRDEDGCASAHDITQVVENSVFRLRVNARKRIVENQNAWIADQGAWAIAVRCFCPPERVMPRSPTMVS